MIEDLHIKNAYKEAYNRIIPDEECIERLLMGQKMKRGNESNMEIKPLIAIMKVLKVWQPILQPVAAVFAVLLLGTFILVPVAAKEIPAVYNIIAERAPQLADFILMEKLTSTSSGIVMQVEAVNVDGSNAEIIVSFSDEEGSDKDYINGEVDLYESYNIESYGAVDNISGCSFLMYNPASDKAYFKIQATSFDKFDKSKLTLTVYQLLTNISSEKKWISLDNIIKNPETKKVVLSGVGGLNDINYKLGAAYEVLDLVEADKSMAEELMVTGVAYVDGYLRIQVCRGTFDDADRHLQPFLRYANGAEVVEDFNVCWQEEVNDEKYLFDEFYFKVEESQLNSIKLYGNYFIIDGSVEGNWDVTMSLE